jgi:hypothetical protein
MPTDHNILFGLKSYQDYADVERQRAMQERQIGLQEQISQAQLSKSMRPDLKGMAEQAFYKAAMGQPLSQEEMGLARAYDISKQQVYTDAFGNTVSRPSVLDRMGGNTVGGMMAPPSATPGYAPPQRNNFGAMIPTETAPINGDLSMPPALPPGTLQAVPAAGGMEMFDSNVPSGDFKPAPNFSTGDAALDNSPKGKIMMAEARQRWQEEKAKSGLAADTEMAKQEAKIEAGALGKIKNTGVTLDAFEQLKAASRSAPSGMMADFKATFANKANIPSDAAKSQGEFSVKKANAENMIRQTFRVVGSGATSDRDAQPFIKMLPDENDSAEVKATKIDAAMEALKRQANTLAQQRSLPLPFEESTPQASGPVDYTEYFK